MKPYQSSWSRNLTDSNQVQHCHTLSISHELCTFIASKSPLCLFSLNIQSDRLISKKILNVVAQLIFGVVTSSDATGLKITMSCDGDVLSILLSSVQFGLGMRL